jgi:Short C-terminal domain
MGLVAARAAGRMQARQNYRTMSRMQRRRSYVQDRVGMKEDFTSREEPVETTATTPAASEPEYVGELERLSQLREQGILSDEEFEAKKKQILGI